MGISNNDPSIHGLQNLATMGKAFSTMYYFSQPTPHLSFSFRITSAWASRNLSALIQYFKNLKL